MTADRRVFLRRFAAAMAAGGAGAIWLTSGGAVYGPPPGTDRQWQTQALDDFHVS